MKYNIFSFSNYNLPGYFIDLCVMKITLKGRFIPRLEDILNKLDNAMNLISHFLKLPKNFG